MCAVVLGLGLGVFCPCRGGGLVVVVCSVREGRVCGGLVGFWW